MPDGAAVDFGVTRDPHPSRLLHRVARIILGHASAVTFEIYADIDREKAKEIMG